MSYTLSPVELCELTGKLRASAQARELEAMGVPYRLRRDGSVAVLRIHAEHLPGAGRQHEPAVNLDGL